MAQEQQAQTKQGERVWHVKYALTGIGSYAYDIGCMCDEWKGGEPHHHQDGIVRRAPDRIVRQPCDPLYKPEKSAA